MGDANTLTKVNIVETPRTCGQKSRDSESQISDYISYCDLLLTDFKKGRGQLYCYLCAYVRDHSFFPLVRVDNSYIVINFHFKVFFFRIENKQVNVY